MDLCLDWWSALMPVSHHEGKSFICDRLIRDNPIDILDVGPGEGIYSILMRPELDYGAYWECVEVWEPYVKKFDLESKYDSVIVDDVRNLTPWQFMRDVVIFGDVIEHLPRDEGVEVLERAKERAEIVIVSIPIVHMPQGAYQGNPHEAHLAHYTFEEMYDIMSPCETFRGDVLGVFYWKREVEYDV